MLVRGVLLATVFVIALLLPGSAATAEAPDATPTLFLRGEDPFRLNFTTVAPNASDPTGVEAILVQSTHSQWSWYSNFTEAWHAPAGTVFEVVLYLDRLETLAPVANPVYDPDGLGRVKVSAFLNKGGIMQDESGSLTLDSYWLDPAPAPVEVRVQITTNQAYTWDPAANETFGVAINVTGYATAENRARILVGSTETPSRLVAPGFPIAGFAAWEEAERREAECNRLLLEGHPCEETSDEENEVEPVPGIGVGVVVAVLALFQTTRRRLMSRG